MSSGSFVRLSHVAFTSGLVAKLGPNAFAVWCVLLKHSNGADTECYPSHATIAEQAGVSVKTSQRAVAKLEEHGLVRVERRKDTSSRTRNVYFMLDSDRESPSIGTESRHVETESRHQPSEIATVSPLDSDCESLEIATESRPKKNQRRTKKKSAFAPPSLEEVKREVTARGLSIDAERFWSYYESQGWKKSNGQMVKNWQACLTTWAKNRRNTSSQISTFTPIAEPPPIRRMADRRVSA